MKNIIPLSLILFLLAGCGDFQWLPESQPVPPAPTTPAGTVQKTIPFPSGITWVIDVASDRTGATLWLLVGTSSTSPATALVQVNSSTGQVVQTIAANNTWPAFINQNSSLAFDGQRFWVTGSGATPQNFIYELDSAARVIAPFQCPATATGFCQGLAWDGTTFWTAGSDNATLTRFQVAGTALSSQNFNNLWDSAGVTDVAFDTGTKQVLVTKGQLRFFSPQQAGVVATQSLPQTGPGDWDGSLLWVIDNANRKILGMTIR